MSYARTFGFSLVAVVLLFVSWPASEALAGDKQACDEGAVAKAITAIRIAPIGARARKAADIAQRHCRKLDPVLRGRLFAMANGEPVGWGKITPMERLWERTCNRHDQIDIYLTRSVSETNLKRTYKICRFAATKVMTADEFVKHQEPARAALALITYSYLRDHGISHAKARRVARMMASLEG